VQDGHRARPVEVPDSRRREKRVHEAAWLGFEVIHRSWFCAAIRSPSRWPPWRRALLGAATAAEGEGSASRIVFGRRLPQCTPQSAFLVEVISHERDGVPGKDSAVAKAGSPLDEPALKGVNLVERRVTSRSPRR
jgi:hypothetical protein